ncbi:MAG: alpha-hydroxy acid oxidase [Pseudomonadota bacterium]
MQALEIKDLYRQARRRVPRMFFDYADSGSWREATYAANERDLQDILFRQRVAVDIEERTTSGTMVGQSVRMPVALSPVGMCGMQYADGEIHAAKAAQDFGVPFCLSTMSICSIEDVADHTDTPFWFQLYVMRDRDFAASLIARARRAACSALVLTLDLQVLGQRHRDLRNGLAAPPKLNLNTLSQLASCPMWCWRMLRTSRRSFGNIVGHAKGVTNLSSLAAWTHEQFDPTLSWEDVGWIRGQWEGPLILKGIMDPEDARAAVAAGADAIIVSNHGGRQLDGAPSSIAALSEIVAAVGNQIEVHVDGGIRSGQDVLRALCLGARGCYIGRAYLYGLGAGGEMGVTRALEIIENELSITLGLCGERDINTVGRHNLAYVPAFMG